MVRVDEHSLPADTLEGRLITHDQSIRTTLALPLLRGDRCLGASCCCLALWDATSRRVETSTVAGREGWVRALDLRDKETEGHTQRVTAMTLRLARRVGVPEAELVHVRRGVLLHDLGKIGIPDHILLKRGPLDPFETAVMREHPRLAHEMLAPIGYLRPALDVPFCHHERWDGTGYPRGLSGEEIPLAARLFAVVDVWDALSFDRHYREAWPDEKVRGYIAENAGTLFDPWVVEEFFELLAEDEATAADDPPVG